jgi:hypothetical protein
MTVKSMRPAMFDTNPEVCGFQAATHQLKHQTERSSGLLVPVERYQNDSAKAGVEETTRVDYGFEKMASSLYVRAHWFCRPTRFPPIFAFREELVEVDLGGVPGHFQAASDHLRRDGPVLLPEIFEDLLIQVGGHLENLVRLSAKEVPQKRLMTGHRIHRT